MFSATYNYVKKATLTELIQFIAGVLAIIAIVFGAYFYMEARYAKAEENKKDHDSISTGMKKMGELLDLKITRDLYKDIEQRIYRIEDRMRGKPIDQWPQEVKDEYRRLQGELKELREDLTIMKSKQKEMIK